jgi:hypothetical protein
MIEAAAGGGIFSACRQPHADHSQCACFFRNEVTDRRYSPLLFEQSLTR